MTNFARGYLRVAAASPKLKVADVTYNTQEIMSTIDTACKEHCHIVVFPELCISGYSCGDLFYQEILIEKSRLAVHEIACSTKKNDIFIVVGLPVLVQNKLFNCLVAIFRGKILGAVPKTHLPNTNEFYEKRWFCSASDHPYHTLYWDGVAIPFGTDLLFCAANFRKCIIGLEICEDLWAVAPPSGEMAINGATIICNGSASNEYIEKVDLRKSLVTVQSARCISGYIYASCGPGESTTDLVYAGHSLIVESGTVLEESSRFCNETNIIISDLDVEKLTCQRLKNSTFFTSNSPKKMRFIEFCFQGSNGARKLKRPLSRFPFLPLENKEKSYSEILELQSIALAKRMEHIGKCKLVIGVSGGLDSTLALLVCVKAIKRLKRKCVDIVAITMPGMGTTSQTKSNAEKLAENLQVTLRTISIKEAVLQHFSDIDHNPQQHNITFENAQARERTQILMDVANQVGGFVVGTGDLSELALGWCTYNADHMSMYSVNVGIPKTLIIHLLEWYAATVDKKLGKILNGILATPISPELLPHNNDEIEQKTEDTVGPYILHDFFLYHHLYFQFAPQKIFYLAQQTFYKEYSPEEISKWLRIFYKRFFQQQYKRSCLPDGPKILAVSLSPRGDWRMPSDAESKLWLKDCP
ncbi:NAD(+) synthase [Candidatus Uabimicrobium sp. HlEnr_7]|uniref:NAD(+) synthase n=1 Tax=Candidatus Uabimicrobium helgolandensis TaxID=3095367 RepID=UPI003558588C